MALLGDPVSHSLSPAFQNAAIRAARLDAVYLAIRCSPKDLPGLLNGIARGGGAGNITVPHKELAADLLDMRTDAVERTGACNTFWLEGDQVWGDNTDVAGFARAVEGLLQSKATGARVLLIGAGGAARAALYSLVEQNAEEVVVLNRSPLRAEALAARFSDARTRVRVASTIRSLAEHPFDLAVNATSLGLRQGDPLPLESGSSVIFRAALDLVYAPDRTDWVRECLTRGIPAADGLEMLLFQGAAAFQRWWGVEPPLRAMRTALPPR